MTLSNKWPCHLFEEISLRYVPHGRYAANASPSRRYDSRRYPRRQSCRFLETVSLHPPLAVLRLFPHAPHKEEPVKRFSLVTEILGGPQAETVKVFSATHMSRQTGQPLAASPLHGCRVPFTGNTFLFYSFASADVKLCEAFLAK